MLCSQTWMIVTPHLVKMVQSVWINMVATHVSALISGLVTTVPVPYILILAGYTCNSTCLYSTFLHHKFPKTGGFYGNLLEASVVHFYLLTKTFSNSG